MGTLAVGLFVLLGVVGLTKLVLELEQTFKLETIDLTYLDVLLISC